MKTLHTLHSGSAEETEAIGRRLGALLEPGDVVLLQGSLGAGKTALTKGITHGAGSSDLVTSPTFVLINEYRGRLKLYHVDLYRLEDPAEILVLDLPGYTTDGALIVEWPERGAGLLPDEHLLLRIAHTGETAREISIEAESVHARRLAGALADTAPAALHG